MDKLMSALTTFARAEDGGQVVEYALIIALVSIALAIALAAQNGGIRESFADLVTRVRACFAANATSC